MNDDGRLMQKLTVILTRVMLGVGVLFLAYLVSAPPILRALMRGQPNGETPAIYLPVRCAWENAFTGPCLLWYFNTVWHCEIEVLGRDGA